MPSSSGPSGSTPNASGQRDRVAAGVHGDVGDQRLAEEGQQLLAVAPAALAEPGDPGAGGRGEVAHSCSASNSAYAAARSRSILRPSK